MSCKSILVVEDDEDIRIQVIQALRAEGYQVHGAENGKVALDYLLSLRPQDYPGCIILDLMMPIMDGKAFLEALASQIPEAATMKVLVATAKGSPVNPDRVPGAVSRIQKPFDLNELYKAVEEHCGGPPQG